MMANPHSLIEGVIIASYAIRAQHAFIYVRGEVVHVVRRLQHAVAARRTRPATSAPTSSARASTWTSWCTPAPAPTSAARRPRCSTRSRAAGASRGSAAVPGDRRPLRRPTVVNNVESIASVPSHRRATAPTGSRRWAPRSRTGYVDLLAVRPRHRPGPVRGAARHHAARAAGAGRRHARRPPAQVLDARRIVDAAADRRAPGRAAGLRVGVGAAGSMLGTRALQIFDETTCVVRAALRWTEFYQHESCGKCTPCREGTYWMVADPAAARGRPGHRRRTWTSCWTSATTSSAARSARSATARPARSRRRSSTSATSTSTHLTHGGCPFDPAAATLFAEPQRDDRA